MTDYGYAIDPRPADEEPAFLDDEGPSDDLPTRITLPKS